MSTGTLSKRLPLERSHLERSPLKFFLLTFTLATPFWMLNLLIKVEGLPLDIPVTDFALAFMPLTAAAILIYKKEGPGGVKELLKRVLDFRKIKQKIWYVPTILLMPLLYLLIYKAIGLMGRPFPEPHISFLTIPLFFVMFFALAAGEELGWMGYAVDPMQERGSALTTSIILGSVWSIAHYPSMIKQGRNLKWIAWGTLGMLGMRTLIVWLYNNTGKSLFAVIFFHAMANVGRVAFPADKTHNPLVDYPGVHYSILAAAALIVAILWGPKTLARYMYARSKA